MASSNPSKAPQVTLILVNYKTREITLACLRSLAQMTYPNFRVILVDQHSEDGSVEAVRAQHPWVKVIENPVNDGFTGGNNLGLREALKEPTDYLFLLNTDTEVEADLLNKLVAPMEADPQIGIIGPAMLYFSKPELIWWAGSHINRRGRPEHYEEGVSITTLDMRLREVGYVCGCGMLIRRTVLEQVGLLDNRFFMYYEEADLCARARRAGWKIMFLPSARLWHKVSQAAEAIGSDLGTYHSQRNRLLYLWKNGDPRLAACAFCIGSTVKAAVLSLLRGERHEALVTLRALRDSLTGRWGSTFFSYPRPPKPQPKSA